MRRMAPTGALLVCLTGCVITPMPMTTEPQRGDETPVSAEAADSAESSAGVEPGVLKGRVVGTDGRPLRGAKIIADNQFLYNSNLIVPTDADGRYRVETDVAATFRVTATMEVERDGVKYLLDLHPENDASFAGPTGAIRDFTWKLTGEKPDGLGHYGGLVLFHLDSTDPQDPEAYLEDEQVELMLTPESPLLDGSRGKVITRRAIRTPDGPGLVDVPIARYRISAAYAGRPLQVALRDQEEYAPELVADFSEYLSTVYWIRLDLKL